MNLYSEPTLPRGVKVYISLQKRREEYTAHAPTRSHNIVASWNGWIKMYTDSYA
jgi:hypothetical protein